MKAGLAALACGTLFGLGLSVSEMINPARVVGFLDVAGAWDVTLAFVMGGALAVTVVTFPLILRRARPLLASRFNLPSSFAVDRQLVVGSVLFGIGWGLAGLCPGPAIAALATLSPSAALFVAAMAAGQWLVSRFE